MARPRIFISSTYYDLKDIRSSLEQFVESMGYEPVLSEKGTIAYDPDKTLDESCYREVENSDIFVLIIGGRYGSPVSDERDIPKDDFFDRYKSITMREYESAVTRDIPIYILVEKSVYTEYETFKRNRENKDIKYAHVMSVNVFLLLDNIFDKTKNNPLHQFEQHPEIVAWLLEQWSGLFKEMLSNRSNQKQLSSLGDQVSSLAEISTTLKTYLEKVMSNVVGIDKDEVRKLIEAESERLAESKRMTEFANHGWIKNMVEKRSLISLADARKLFSEAKTVDEVAERISKLDPDQKTMEQLIEIWRPGNYGIDTINEIRKILDLLPIDFKTSNGVQ